MKTNLNYIPKFAVCISTDDPDLLTPRMIYRVLPDESAARSNYVRIIDNEGEDYLYPSDYFIFIEIADTVENALIRALPEFRDNQYESFQSVL